VLKETVKNVKLAMFQKYYLMENVKITALLDSIELDNHALLAMLIVNHAKAQKNVMFVMFHSLISEESALANALQDMFTMESTNVINVLKLHALNAKEISDHAKSVTNHLFFITKNATRSAQMELSKSIILVKLVRLDVNSVALLRTVLNVLKD